MIMRATSAAGIALAAILAACAPPAGERRATGDEAQNTEYEQAYPGTPPDEDSAR